MPGWTRASFRRLFPWEAGRYAAHLRALTPDGRRTRFFGRVDDDALHAHACRATDTGHVEGCFLDGRLIGAFELYFSPGARGCAQVALSVDPAHEGTGLGTELMTRARSRAGLIGASGIELQMQADNGAMLALVRRAGASITRHGTELHATLAVPEPDLRRLGLALAWDEASLLRGLFSAIRNAARAARPRFAPV